MKGGLLLAFHLNILLFFQSILSSVVLAFLFFLLYIPFFIS